MTMTWSCTTFFVSAALAFVVGVGLVRASVRDHALEESVKHGDDNDDVTIKTRLPYCPPKKETPIVLGENNSVLVVSTLDGRITALDPFASSQGENDVLWSILTEPGEMLSSTISQIEMTNNAKWVKLIPSLAGGLYKFDGETIEPVPLNAETLLKTSFKFADNTIITGGKESRTYGIEMDSGKVRYECSLEGCNHYFGDDNMDDVLIVQRETQTVRAVEPRTGHEKWNFSVSQHTLDFNTGLEDLCQSKNEEDVSKENEFGLESTNLLFKAVVSDGIICSVDKSRPEMIKWSHKFDTPIVHAWEIRQGKLIKVDLFSSSHIPNKHPRLEDDDESDERGKQPVLYIGTHNKQFYIQESDHLMDSKAESVQDTSMLNFPKVSWKPYLISAVSRTPIYNHGSRIEKDDVSRLPLLTYEDKAAENTAVAVFSGSSEYPFDSGLYLYPDEPILEYEPLLDFKGKENESKDNNKAGEKTNDSSDDEYSFGDSPGAQSIQIVFVSLWYWWKEVVFISLVTAFMMNWLITRPYIHAVRENFQRHLEHVSRRNPQEVVFVEVPVPMDTRAPQTPNTNSTDSLKELNWSQSQNNLNEDSNNFTSRFLTDFEPLQCLGKGGFGVVFESKNKIDDSHYAVKRIRLPESDTEKRKVMREVKFLAKLDHKNIVRYFNTWLERPPPGWQDSADSWWKNRLDGSPSRTGAYSPTFESTSDPHQQASSVMSYSATESTCPKDSLRLANNDSFSIVFEQSHSQQENNDAIKDDTDVTENDSKLSINFDSECDDALVWEEKHQKAAKKDTRTDVDQKREKCHVYLYIVMQLCQKESLRDWLRSPNRDRKRSLHMFHDICLGVEYVHSQGLIHRDLKPSNIFFTSDGTVKIGDFGLVTGQHQSIHAMNEFEDGINNSEAGGDQKVDLFDPQRTDKVGTELYMSPEQVERKPYDHKVDIYSLGLILFELLVPFGTQMERVRTLQDLRSLRFPDHFVDQEEFPLVKSMLLHDPKLRPETAEVLEMDFMQTVRNEMATDGFSGDYPDRQRRKRLSTSCSITESS